MTTSFAFTWCGLALCSVGMLLSWKSTGNQLSLLMFGISIGVLVVTACGTLLRLP